MLLQARVLGPSHPNTPFHPGHLPAVGWAYIIFDVSIDFIAIFLSCALHCCVGFTSSLYRTLVRDALYASTRPLLEQRLTRARRQLLICVHCSVVYFWPFLSCKMLENGYFIVMVCFTSVFPVVYAHRWDRSICTNGGREEMTMTQNGPHNINNSSVADQNT